MQTTVGLCAYNKEWSVIAQGHFCFIVHEFALLSECPWWLVGPVVACWYGGSRGYVHGGCCIDDEFSTPTWVELFIQATD